MCLLPTSKSMQLKRQKKTKIIGQGAVYHRTWFWPHDDIIKWKHFPRHWPFLRGFLRSTVDSPHKVLMLYIDDIYPWNKMRIHHRWKLYLYKRNDSLFMIVPFYLHDPPESPWQCSGCEPKYLRYNKTTLHSQSFKHYINLDMTNLIVTRFDTADRDERLCCYIIQHTKIIRNWTWPQISILAVHRIQKPRFIEC